MDIKSLATIEKVLSEKSEGFTPTEAQKKAKSRFWATCSGEGGPTPSPLPNIEQALQFGSIDRKWWDESGFRDWFWNRNEFNERLEYIGLLALEELESTLKSKLVTSAQKIPAIKLALEVAHKLGGKGQGESIDLPDKLANMSKKQLEDFIESRRKLLTTESTDDKIVPKLQ